MHHQWSMLLLQTEPISFFISNAQVATSTTSITHPSNSTFHNVLVMDSTIQTGRLASNNVAILSSQPSHLTLQLPNQL